MAYIANQDRRLLFLDSETGGLDPLHNEAIEWAAILTEPDGTTEIDAYEAKVKPTFPERMEAKAVEVNGYKEAEWVDAPPAKDVASRLLAMSSGVILVGQNVSFDENFLTAFFKKFDFKPAHHYHKIDTMVLAWPLIKSGKISGLSLTNLAEWAGVEQVKPHRAMADARTVQTVYNKLMAAYASL